jgi:hypothetical protein
VWVPDDFPKVLVGVEEVSGITAIESGMGFFEDGGAGVAGLGEEGIDFGGGVEVMGEHEIGRSRGRDREAGFVGNTGAGPKSESEAGLEFKKDDGAVLKFGADDALSGKAEAVAIETKGALEIIDAEGDEGDARFHERFLEELGSKVKQRGA